MRAEAWALLVALGLLAGCASRIDELPDGPAGDLSQPIDQSLAPSPDLSSLADLARLDLTAPLDLTTSPDLTTPMDFTTPIDLTTPLDFTTPPDFAIAPDLARPADLAGARFALSFDSSGAGKVTVPSSAALLPTGALTVEAWATVANVGSTVNQKAAVVGVGDAQATSNATGFQLGYDWNGTQWWASFYVGLGGLSIGCNLTQTGLDSGVHHLAGTFDGAAHSLSLWVDGLFACGTSVAGSIGYPSGAPSIVFGAPPVADPQLVAVSGTLDDVRISNVALYGANFTPTRHFTALASTVGLWPLDDGSGLTAADTSGGGANGTLSSSGVSWIVEP
jgi:hypothetical protein